MERELFGWCWGLSLTTGEWRLGSGSMGMRERPGFHALWHNKKKQHSAVVRDPSCHNNRTEQREELTCKSCADCTGFATGRWAEAYPHTPKCRAAAHTQTHNLEEGRCIYKASQCTYRFVSRARKLHRFLQSRRTSAVTQRTTCAWPCATCTCSCMQRLSAKQSDGGRRAGGGGGGVVVGRRLVVQFVVGQRRWGRGRRQPTQFHRSRITCRLCPTTNCLLCTCTCTCTCTCALCAVACLSLRRAGGSR